METSDARKRRVGTSDDQGDRQGGESRSTVAFCGSGGMNYSDVVPAKALLGDLIDTSREFQAKAGHAGHEEVLALAVKTDHLKHKIRAAYVQARWRAVEFERVANMAIGGAA